MIEIGSRKRKQPPPPNIVFEALSNPDRDPRRPWLDLLWDEQRPTVLRSQAPMVLVWASLWTKRPDAVIEFALASSTDGGTDLRWTLFVEEPVPTEPLIGHMRNRLNQLINADLRSTFGQ
jgi:hypothetical protein